MKKTLDYLRHALVELTPACNLRCRHCYNGWKRGSAEPVAGATYRQAFRVLDFLIRQTTVERLIFTGGEPTLAERFPELVLHALVSGRKVTVISNGNGPERVYSQLAELPVDMIEFSIHAATPELHDRITGVAGSWSQVMRNARRMQKAGIEVVPVLVVTALNVSGGEAAMRLFAASGFRRVLVNRYNLSGPDVGQAAALSATVSGLRAAFRRIDEAAERLGLKVSSGACTPYCLLDPADYPHIGFGACSENLYARPLTFDVEGNLRLCNHSPVVAGNIFQQPLAAILGSAYAAAWAETGVPACTGCARWAVCRGGCRAASEQMGWPLSVRDPAVDWLGA